MGRGWRRFASAVVVSATAAVAAGCGSATPTRHAAPHPHHVATTTTTAASASFAGVRVPVSTETAQTNGAIPGYAAPGDAAPDRTVPSNWYGYPSILPVVATQPGWLEVRLAQRPNQSTTWVRTSDVTLSSTPYAIVIDLASMHFGVFENGAQIDDFPAGIGAPGDPTPTGQYFMTMKVPPPNSSYGPFVLATSDHSDTISDWENSGDAIIGIHGPISSYDDSLIGTTGAAISHGCVRLHDADLAQLANIPAGTPIDIVN
jgi:lipoprotein-anchoring transpeptidase ErfK/SrfK